MAGKIDIVRSASWGLALSIRLPIIGSTIETESIPAAPIMDKPKAPVSGRYSATKPSIVGQKKVTPIAKTPAAKNVVEPLVIVNNQRPINVNIAEKRSVPDGCNL